VRAAIVDADAALQRGDLAGDGQRVAPAAEVAQFPFAIDADAFAGGGGCAKRDGAALAFLQLDGDFAGRA
jgi:hypothetical protein